MCAWVMGCIHEGHTGSGKIKRLQCRTHPVQCGYVTNWDKAPNAIDYSRNPELKGCNAKEVMDKLISMCAEMGLLVLLDFHRLNHSEISSLEARQLPPRSQPQPSDFCRGHRNQSTWAERRELLGGKRVVGLTIPCPAQERKQVVYSPHVYGCDVCDMTYYHTNDFPTNLTRIWDRKFGDLTKLGHTLCIGEFGSKYESGSKDEIIQNLLARYIADKGMSAFL